MTDREVLVDLEAELVIDALALQAEELRARQLWFRKKEDLAKGGG